MPRRIRVSSIKKRVSHLRRQSHLLHHFRVKATLAILLVLAIVLGVHAYVENHRVSGDADDPEVVVGTTPVSYTHLDVYKRQAYPIAIALGNLLDPPATMVNAAGDYVVSFIVSRFVDGKDWLQKKLHSEKA